MRIHFHKEYGLNPSLDLCFWCGEATGVALLGANKGQKAPREMVSSYVPCNKCQSDWERGVTMIAVTTFPNGEGQPPINPEPRGRSTMGHIDLYPTGALVVVRPEAVRRIFEEDMAESAVSKGRAYIELGAFNKVFGDEIKRMNQEA